ncbi:dnaJ homolog subfamily B member 9 [Dioscorea cayenensis subsp. rotundata]|uniref:DnaJ homolog subfamily B member 9 n=1 Tax=Dioscorea cayennensis subsp. rotundata TaxID=55577 RepID=A0AB40BI36_DIOCR|nr:dnaJ homolog subfamily B member 9 [Dioscorea cayenensis subsp. rotundata]
MEICNISSSYSSCTHHCSSIRKPVFVDWYLILSVDEDAGIDVIRKRYHQLALQLHPDKNRHPKAEVAFKIVSEGYACLTDKSKRKAFDSERNSFCRECRRKLQKSPVEHYNRRDTDRLKSRRMIQALKEVQNRIKAENRVIENCLRANRASREGSPLFDPSDRLSFPGYPHQRTHIFQKPQEIKCESPLYQIRKKHT